jgi:hypothetical protein
MVSNGHELRVRPGLCDCLRTVEKCRRKCPCIFSRTKRSNVPSNSAAARTAKSRMLSVRALDVRGTSPISSASVGSSARTRKATRTASGTSCLSNPTRLPTSPLSPHQNPVILPLGRAMLLASPSATGSGDEFITIGTARLTSRTANAAGGDPATMTAGFSATKSAARAGITVSPDHFRFASANLGRSACPISESLADIRDQGLKDRYWPRSGHQGLPAAPDPVASLSAA